jgi:uncharacterized membrane protein YidH (DUF202 family)
MTRDPGLQPERTSMSWLRTQLVLFAIGLLIFKIANSYGDIVASILGFISMIFAISCSFYTQRRFRPFFIKTPSITVQEQNIKKILTGIISILSLCYLVIIWTQ